MEKNTDENKVLIPQGNYFKINLTTTVPFCNGKIEIENCQAIHGEYRVLLAQLEVMGIPYLDALEKQNILIEHKEKIRKLLEENIPPTKRNLGERPPRRNGITLKGRQ